VNEKPNEWVAVADLMSGVLAVVALMLVAAILLSKQQAAAKASKVTAAAPPASAPSSPAARPVASPEGERFEELDRFLRDYESTNTDPSIRVDVAERRIRLADGAFDHASACLLPGALQSLKGWRAKFPKHLLTGEGQSKVTLEISGYTDSDKVSGLVNDAKKCARYEDNVGLSVARATQAREELIKGLSPELARHFIVAGYGDTRPLPNLHPSDPQNRRVEVRFVSPVRLGASQPVVGLPSR
jgi:chemotaxis protein MotB